MRITVTATIEADDATAMAAVTAAVTSVCDDLGPRLPLSAELTSVDYSLSGTVTAPA